MVYRPRAGTIYLGMVATMRARGDVRNMVATVASPTRAPMPKSNAILRPSERAATEAAELELPLAPSPPLSVAASPLEPLSGSGVSLRVSSDLAEIEAEWKAFERHADHTPFQSFDWLAAW